MPRNTRIFPGNFCLIAAAFFFISCGTKDKKPPIAPAQMKAILMDIHLAEAYSSLIVKDSVQKKQFNKNTDSLALYYKNIFAKYDIEASKLEKAMEWYALHPEELDTVYARMMAELDKSKTAPPPAK